MKKILCIIMMILLVFCLTACADADTLQDYAELEMIQTFDVDNIVKADEHTGILYYFYSAGDHTYMCPYYSENGYLCRYENGYIKEIKNDDVK